MWNTFGMSLLLHREHHWSSLSLSLSLSHSIVFHVFHLTLRRGSTSSLSHFLELYGAASVAPMWFPIVLSLLLRQCETHSQCASLAPPREPLKLSLLHSIVFHIALRGGWIPTLHLTFFGPFFWELTWQNDKAKHRALRNRDTFDTVLSFLDLSRCCLNKWVKRL